ncbi:RNA-binding protein 48-like [Styela clava]
MTTIDDENGDLEESIEKLPTHHKKLEYCLTRREYRKGKRSTAVKVFTVNSESQYIMVRNVHATGLEKELVNLFSKYGTVVKCETIDEYPKEPFTQVFLVKFQDIQAARVAKRKADEMYFFGSMLHVFYAPEHETVDETRNKLMQRRIAVVSRLRNLAKEKNHKLKGRDKVSKEFETPGHTKSSMLSDKIKLKGDISSRGNFAKLTSSMLCTEFLPATSKKRLLIPQQPTNNFLHQHKDRNMAPSSVNTDQSNQASSSKPKFIVKPGYIRPNKS